MLNLGPKSLCECTHWPIDSSRETTETRFDFVRGMTFRCFKLAESFRNRSKTTLLDQEMNFKTNPTEKKNWSKKDFQKTKLRFFSRDFEKINIFEKVKISEMLIFLGKSKNKGCFFFSRAKKLSTETKPENLIGVAVTATLSTTYEKLGSHRFFICIHGYEATHVFSCYLTKGKRTRCLAWFHPEHWSTREGEMCQEINFCAEHLDRDPVDIVATVATAVPTAAVRTSFAGICNGI